MNVRNTIENNRHKWGHGYDWSQEGDEWVELAQASGQPYADWKRSIVARFIDPYCPEGGDVVEIAPGHGRWAELLAPRCRALALIDLSPECVEHCRKRFEHLDHVRCVANDGRSLPGVDDASIDFIWSFDSFVHIDPPTIGQYLGEFNRVLRPGGHAVIQHAGRRHAALPFAGLRDGGRWAQRLYRWLSVGRVRGGEGWRSDASARLVAEMAREHGLGVAEQVQSRGDGDRFGLRRFRDCITVLRR
jgi:ubiquinone/menaquinone biosynthesis C-methylase UbiE